MSYHPIPAQIDLPELEHQILEYWQKSGTFAASLDARAEARPWTFFEGPPTANGQPGTHHVEARAFKDMFPRYQTMRGRRVDRRAGWDCHGLPVELAVEKELGINGKPEIEKYGIAEFNAHCRESVLRNVSAFTEMTDRMGYWVDMDQAYVTMRPEYIESVWWALKSIHGRGLLVEDYRVAPYCPRCGTTLSDHELAQGYEDIVGPSVYVRMPLTSGPLAGQASLLVWTTTPWTLPANTAVAANPEVTYVVISNGTELVVVAEPLVDRVSEYGSGEWTIQARYAGRDLEHWNYQRPFELVSFPQDTEGVGSHFVVLADYVTTSDGTGLVHQAPAFGADDLEVCRSYGLPIVNPVQSDGRFEDSLALIGGMFFKDADPLLSADLEERGLLFEAHEYEHSYPHCWRCHTALIYYATPSWYIRTTQIKDALLAENENINWFPDSVKNGRFGDWLGNNVDWALSRNRYWGTPLPIWRNDADPEDMIVVGSRAELSELTQRDLSDLDPHRPFIDDVTFTVEGKPGTYRRVPEVIDAWFDSGAMPFAQWGYPHVEGSQEGFERAFPADFICEAIDQTRGWFYTLLAVSTAVFEKSSYRNVLCLGHILAEDGRKMSKHLGNVLLPMPLMEEHGADALRWFMVASGSPWSARRVGHTTLQEIVRKVLLTYWNVAAFQSLYARANDWEPTSEPPPMAERTVLDQWLATSTVQLTVEVSEAMEQFDSQRAGSLLAAFVDDLSNWYVRRSRRRFWEGDPAVLATLHETLDVLTRLLAPMVPFITERVWQDLFAATDDQVPASVHLADWPTTSAEVDLALVAEVRESRKIIELGRTARAEAKFGIRQPLSRALVSSNVLVGLREELRAEVCAELNVAELVSFSAAGDIVGYEAKANFRALGRRFAKRTPAVAAAIVAADAEGLFRSLDATGEATVDLDGESIVVTAQEVIVNEKPLEGWAIANTQGHTVALDLTLTPELVRAGLARQVTRWIQEQRKQTGLKVTDRIRLSWSARSEELAEAIRANQELIASEVLAVEVSESASLESPLVEADLGLEVRFEVSPGR